MKTYTLSLICLLTQFAITHGQHRSRSASSAVKIDPHQRRRYALNDMKEPSDDEGGEDDNNGGGGNTDESPDVKSLMYYNADKITQNVQDGLLIEQSRDSTPPGTYTNVKEDGTVELKCIDNDSIQGDGIHIWVAHGSGKKVRVCIVLSCHANAGVQYKGSTNALFDLSLPLDDCPCISYVLTYL